MNIVLTDGSKRTRRWEGSEATQQVRQKYRKRRVVFEVDEVGALEEY